MATTKNAVFIGYNLKIYLMQGGVLTFGGRGFFVVGEG